MPVYNAFWFGRYKKLAEKGIAIQAETDTLYTRIHELEDDLNVVQATLFDERENYVKLVAENEQLKVSSYGNNVKE